MQETMPGARRRGRRGQESGLPMEESIKMTEDRDRVRPWCGQPSDRGRLKNRREHTTKTYHISY